MYLNEYLDRISLLDGFTAHEVNILQYTKQLDANLPFHIDDTWIWGERIYGLNLMSDTVLTFQLG